VNAQKLSVYLDMQRGICGLKGKWHEYCDKCLVSFPLCQLLSSVNLCIICSYVPGYMLPSAYVWDTLCLDTGAEISVGILDKFTRICKYYELERRQT
jgi:hypothetical protein